MDLSYIVRTDRDDDGSPYEVHFLVDEKTSRAWGYVDTPTPKETMFTARPYEGQSRWYTSIDAAKGYLERMAVMQSTQESEDECKSLGLNKDLESDLHRIKINF